MPVLGYQLSPMAIDYHQSLTSGTQLFLLIYRYPEKLIEHEVGD
jgi:hypothetical protein